MRGPRPVPRLAALLLCGIAAGCGSTESLPPADLAVPVEDLAAPLDLLPQGDLPARPPCEPFNQTFCPPTAKCTVQRDDIGRSVPVCVELTGNKRAGERCTRVGDKAGMDDCAAGLYCTGAGRFRANPPFETYCRTFCRSDADCTGLNERCAGAGIAVGACVPVCTVLSADCPQGMSCTQMVNMLDETIALGCAEYGSARLGDSCKTQFECPPDSVCWLAGEPDARCLAYCDAMHPCASGQCMHSRYLLGWNYYTCQ